MEVKPRKTEILRALRGYNRRSLELPSNGLTILRPGATFPSITRSRSYASKRSAQATLSVQRRNT